MAVCPAPQYRARQPRTTPLYRLAEELYDEVKGLWEERFERRYGFWRGMVDEQVRRYLDCGIFENGFARIRCPDCHAEYLLAFSCKTRDLCPSCAAKRGAATAALLAEDVLEQVGHAQWVFVIPKMLRPDFLHHRELLGPQVRHYGHESGRFWSGRVPLFSGLRDWLRERPVMAGVASCNT